MAAFYVPYDFCCSWFQGVVSTDEIPVKIMRYIAFLFYIKYNGTRPSYISEQRWKAMINQAKMKGGVK
jgi:hypothetical protein